LKRGLIDCYIHETLILSKMSLFWVDIFSIVSEARNAPDISFREAMYMKTWISKSYLKGVFAKK